MDEDGIAAGLWKLMRRMVMELNKEFHMRLWKTSDWCLMSGAVVYFLMTNA